MDASLRRFSLPLRTPLETAAGPIERREGFLVRLVGGGITGVGEATPLDGWTEDLDTCQDQLEAAVTRLEADGPDEALESLAGRPAARHGLSLALLDRAAKAADRPLYRHLGGDGPVETIPVNAVIGDGDPSTTAAAAAEATAAGFTCLKVKVGGRSVDADATRLRAVRDAVGPVVPIRADANGAWDADEARAALGAFADVGVEYVEQPLAAEDLDGHRELCGGPVAVALDETLAHVDLERVIDRGAADVLILKPMVLGGLDRVRTAVDKAVDAALGVVVSNTVDGVVARTGAAHLAASLDDPYPAGLATAELLAQDVAADPAPVTDGRMAVPQTPGHGVILEEASS